MAVRVSVLLAILALGARPASAQQHYLGITVDMSASEVHSHIGRRTTFVCPAVTTTQLAGVQIYGTDQYTYDSAVCIAAVHAGVLGLGAAGPVTIVTDSGADNYVGSSRNGVTSLGYGPYGSSYRFDSGPQPGRIDWITTAQYFPEEVTGPIVVECPSGGSMSYGVWGTGVYTIDSSICMAAVHAGAIPRDAGGLVTVTRMPGQEMYPPSVSNGVTSGSWGQYHASFSVGTAVPNAPMGPPPGVYIYAGSLTIMMLWTPVAGATYTICRETPPGAACAPVSSQPVINAGGDYYFADMYLPPYSTHAYRVRATYSDGTVGETRLTQRNQGIGPPLNPTVDFSTFAATRAAVVSWEPYGMPGYSGPTAFDTHLVMGPGITRGQVVAGDRVTVQVSDRLGTYQWQICSMVANPAGGWWYSENAAVLTYTGAPGAGTASRTTAPCTVLPEGDGTIIVPPTRGGR